MPRISSEAKSAALFRSGNGRVMEPPGYLEPDVQTLWREIVASKPADRFDAGSAPLLEMFCCFAVHARWLLQEMEKAKATSEAAAQLERRVGAMSKMLSMLSGKLRLSVNSRIDRRSGELDEPGDGELIDDRLLGGLAVNRRTN